MGAVLATAIAGCGGGGGSGGAPVLEGHFLDAAVEGISYQTSDAQGGLGESGTTDAQGRFRYRAGDRVVFSIGSLSLPAATAAAVVTPLDLAGSRRLDDPKVSNLLVLLQSLDADGNPANGIKIMPAAASAITPDKAIALGQALLKQQAADFSAQSDLLTLVRGATGDQNRALVGVDQARQHLLGTLKDQQPNVLVVEAVVPVRFEDGVPQGDSNFRYRQASDIRFTGSGFTGSTLAVESTGACTSMTQVSLTATSVVYRCTPSAVGPIEVKLKRGTEVLASYSEQVALPRVRFDVSTYNTTSQSFVSNNFVVELEAAKAPITTDNFLDYVGIGYYDNTVFHRVIKNFMIQGGGFEIVNNLYSPKADAPGRSAIVLERTSLTGLSNVEGTIAMARTSVPNSATSEFFINVVDNLFLDQSSQSDGYAVFGRVVSDTGGVEAVRNAPVADNGRGELSLPTVPMRIISATRIR
jgi:peptidyl-prolyl cis-trans isomerase A (cyclophilin A)